MCGVLLMAIILERKQVMKLILKYEWKKIFSRKINRVLLFAAFLLAILFSCLAAGSMRYVDEEGITHTGITAARRLAADRNRWEGILTEDNFTEIMQSRKKLAQKYSNEIPDTEFGKTIQSYSDITYFIINVLTSDSDYDENILYQLTDQQIRNLYTTYDNTIQDMIDEYAKTPEQKQFLTKQYKKITMPIHYQAKDSWDTMTMYAETYGIVLAVIIGFLASGIFAEEFRTRAEAVFFSTKYGRSKAIKIKITAGILMTTFIYWVGIGILTLVSFGMMGVSGFHTPYQIYQPYSIYSMTYGQYYLLILLCGYIASLLAASVTMLVAAKMHTANVAVCIPFFLYCVMPFIGRAFSSLTALFRLTPDLLMNIIECAKSPILFQIGTIVLRQIPVLMLLYSILAVIFIPFIYRSYCRYGRKN